MGTIRLLITLLHAMTTLLDRIVSVISRFQATEADLRQQLADALANDKADADAIAAATAAAADASQRASAAEALVSELQANATANADQLAAIERFIGSLEPQPEVQG